MSDVSPSKNKSKKRRRWFCAGCVLLPLFTVLCLAGAFFVGPNLVDALNLFGPGAEEVYGYAPNEAASQEVEEVFEEMGIPGVRVYVIPMKGKPTQGAFVILDASQGYRGLYPPTAEDDHFHQVVQQISRTNQEENLRLAHVTVEYRDENGKRATAFTAPQVLVERYAEGEITQEEFFSQIEIDILTTIEYLELEELLKEIQR